MNCFNHENVPAVAVCKSCGRAMCYDCAMIGGKYDSLCPDCKTNTYKERLKKNVGRIISTTLIGAVIVALVTILLQLLLDKVDDNILLIGAGVAIVVIFLLAVLFNITKGKKSYKKAQEIINPKKKKVKGVVTVSNTKKKGKPDSKQPSEEISSGRIDTADMENGDLYDNMP
ncbi:MAG: hypothetical protein IKD20_04720 [Clostridia bacterium]|nr:hypothetical protein [Clostridia bacterium]